MALDTWITLLVAAVLISLSPGAGAVTAMGYGLSHGVRRALAAVLGLQLGFLAQILIVGIGLGGLIATSVTLYTVIKWIGVGYLIWLGVQKWREGGRVELGAVQISFSPGRALAQSALVNLTNPKSLVFLVALMPQFVDPAGPRALQIAIVGATLLTVDVIVMTGYSGLAARLRALLRNERAVRIQNRVTGSALIGAGLLLSTARNEA